MSATFLFAACPVPLAQYININLDNNNATTSHRYIAPEEAWEKPFRHWLEHLDTANTIMNTVDIYEFAPSYLEWGDAIRDYALDNNLSCVSEPEFTEYCNNLERNKCIPHNAPQYYAHITTQYISSRFMDAAYNVFSGDSLEGMFYKGEFFTGGNSWGDAPTEIFDDVVLLSTINFFDNFPIATVVNGSVVDWQDKEGNSINPPADFND